MKKSFLIGALCALSTMGYAQDSEEKGIANLQDRKHELRIDALEAVAGPAIDISYEYVLSKYSGFGATVWYSFDEDNDNYFIDSGQKFAITPYYRQYFFNKKDYGARGFYAEGLLQLAFGDDADNDPALDTSWTGFGIGFALGQKWVSKNGFVIDLNFGIGRYLDSGEFGPDAFARGGIGFGYRF